MRRSRSLRLVLATALVAGGVVAMAGAANAAIDQVSVLDFRYSEADLTVTEGDTVVWRWDGDDSHTVSAFDESFDSGVKYPGADFAVTFDSPGEYAYFCMIHGPDMSGVVRVMPAGGVAVTPAAPVDNVSTAIAWSKAAVPDGGARTVLIGRDDKFPDALASGAAQGALGAPLLLNPTAALDARVKAELERVGAGEVVVLGGEAAISPAVVTALEDEGYGVTRIGGVDRIATAYFIARRYFRTSDEAIITRAFGPGTAGFADSLGAGALAAKRGVPVLVNPTDKLSFTVKSYLEDAGVTTVHIAGGPAAISTAVEDELENLGYTVHRMGGENRFETNAMLAHAAAGSLFDPDSVVAVIDGAVTNDNAWASGFAAALAVGRDGHLVIANGADVDDRYLEALVDTHPAVICGPSAAAACAYVVNATSAGSMFESGNVFAVASTPVGTGAEGHRAMLDFRPAAADGTACWMTVNGSLDTPVIASHIHRKSDNAAVFGTGEIGPGAEFTYGCGEEMTAGALAAILATPSDYYWNIHFDGTADTVMGDVIVTSDMLLAFGSGDQEVGGGHPTGVTFSLFGFDANADDVVCAGIGSFIFGDAGPTKVNAAHIHDGEAGVNGPPVVTLSPPPAGNLVGGGCVDTDDAALIADIRANPLDYYLNLHTDEHPGGAVRGQLIDILQPFSTPVVVS